MTRVSLSLSVSLFALALALGCTPRVEVAPPTEPIHVIIDVNIKHELYVKLEKDAAKVIDQNEDLF